MVSLVKILLFGRLFIIFFYICLWITYFKVPVAGFLYKIIEVGIIINRQISEVLGVSLVPTPLMHLLKCLISKHILTPRQFLSIIISQIWTINGLISYSFKHLQYKYLFVE